MNPEPELELKAMADSLFADKAQRFEIAIALCIG
jgi:hypothetical protein